MARRNELLYILFLVLVLYETGVGRLSNAQMLTECKDPRAINNNNTPGIPADENRCLYPVMRSDPYSWVTMPQHCVLHGFEWTSMDLRYCYYQDSRLLPPWPRTYKYGCTNPNDCTVPLEIEVINLQVTNVEFQLQTQSVDITFTYGLRWKDQRLFGAMFTDPNDAWKPQLRAEMLLVVDGKPIPLPMLSQSRSTGQFSVVMEKPQCTAEEKELIAQGQNLGCCTSEENCFGVSPINNYISCEHFDTCEVQWIERTTLSSKLPDMDLSFYPFDRHHLQAAVYIANPYNSIDVEWWKLWRPKPPSIVFRDIGSGQAPWDGSLGASLNYLNISDYTFVSKVTHVEKTSLNYLMDQGSDDAFYKIVRGRHPMGVGGITIDFFLSRQSGYISRFYLFPMVLVTLVACLTPMLSDDAIIQVSPRVGMGGVAILTALASSYDMTSASSSQEQLTTVDAVSVLSILFGGLASLEALWAYAWWRKDNCLADEPWTCWFVQAVDSMCCVLFVTIYLYIVGVLLLVPQSTTAAIVWGILGFLVVLVVNVISFLVLKRWSAKAKVVPEAANRDGWGAIEETNNTPFTRRRSVRSKSSTSIAQRPSGGVREPKPRASIGSYQAPAEKPRASIGSGSYHTNSPPPALTRSAKPRASIGSPTSHRSFSTSTTTGVGSSPSPKGAKPRVSIGSFTSIEPRSLADHHDSRSIGSTSTAEMPSTSQHSLGSAYNHDAEIVDISQAGRGEENRTPEEDVSDQLGGHEGTVDDVSVEFSSPNATSQVNVSDDDVSNSRV